MKAMVNVDKGIPMPEFSGAGKYPWKVMEVGDSFLMISKTAARAGSAIVYANTAYAPRHFTKRNMPDGTARVWRDK